MNGERKKKQLLMKGKWKVKIYSTFKNSDTEVKRIILNPEKRNGKLCKCNEKHLKDFPYS
jgi:hypothetical protein